MELKRINLQPESGPVTITGVSGEPYYASESLSIARYVKALVFEKNLQYARTVEQTANDLNKVIALMNKMQFVDASVLLINLRDGVTQIAQERSFVMLLCALFFNREGEDIGVVNMDVLNNKIEDWREYDFQDFFLFVASTLPGCFRVYNQLTQTIMEEMPVMDDLV